MKNGAVLQSVETRWCHYMFYETSKKAIIYKLLMNIFKC